VPRGSDSRRTSGGRRGGFAAIGGGGVVVDLLKLELGRWLVREEEVATPPNRSSIAMGGLVWCPFLLGSTTAASHATCLNFLVLVSKNNS
jgi:hypothetical protein